MPQDPIDDDPFGPPLEPIQRCGKMVTDSPHGSGPCEWPEGHNSPCDPDIWAGLLEAEMAEQEAKESGNAQ
jgi:hypothetical protein